MRITNTLSRTRRGRLIAPATFLLLSAALDLACANPALADTPVMVQGFEKADSLPKVWVVNIPDTNASVKLSTDHPGEGKQSLDLHYHFTGAGQYLGVAIPVQILAPVHKVRFMLYGDGSGSGYGLYAADASNETHKYRNPAAMKVDFKGWKEIVIDLDAPHETWGGDKNGKIDYPITSLTLEVSHDQKTPVESDLFVDAIRVDSERSREETLGSHVAVLAPEYGSDVKGDTRIAVSAPGFKNLTVKCWKQGPGSGSDSTVATVALAANGAGAFVFPADRYPHGPLTVRISGETGTLKDNCYLQLYNRGGVSWKEGIPGTPPPAASGMKLAFADDFNGPLSISSTDPRATYFDHKPLGGDFSTLPFSGYDSLQNPFARRDTYLRIRADAKKNSAGLLSSLKNDGTGIKVSAPCYFECRFLAPNAIGTWPAFWLLTDYPTERKSGKSENAVPVDELDIIEAYGGEGPRTPNSYDLYRVTPHAWNQGDAGKAAETRAEHDLHNPISMHKLGLSTWYEAFHTYGCKITDTDTIYYCDDKEVGRHKTLETSRKAPFFFLINLATGGGWPVDLSRYDGRADMYVDYVRVYQGAAGR